MNTTHKKNTTGLIRKWFTRGMACMALLFAAGNVSAASYTNTASGNWWPGSATIWSNNVAGISGTDTIIVFNPKATDNSTNNNAGAFTLNQLQVVPNQTVNLYSTGGSSLNFVSNAGTLPSITNAGTSTLTINSPITLADNLTISNPSGAITINSNITESAKSDIIKLGNNTLTLSGSNAFTGNLYIKAGTLADQLGGNNGNTRNWGAPTATIYLGDATVGADATLATQCNAGYNGPASAINPIIVVGGAGNRTIRVLSGITAQAWIGGDITLNNNLQFIYNTAATRTLRISSNITGTGNLTFASTTGSSLISLTGVSINPVGIITNNSSGSTGDITISGAIGTNVTAVVQNSATSQMILSGTNTYNGPTTINAGTLFVNGTNTVASGTAGTYTVKSGGTLGGKGKIDLSAVNGSVVVEAGGKLSPGSAANTVGTLNLVLGGGSLDLSAAAGTAGTLVFALGATNTSDKIVLSSGTLNIGVSLLNFASFNFQTVSGFMNATNTYTLISSPGAISGSLASSGLSGTLPSGITGTLAISGNDLVLNLSGVEGVTVQPVTWKGNMSGSWDGATTNWVATGTTTPVYYTDGDAVTFDDTASANFTVSGTTVTPASVSVSNSVNAYTISAPIAGSGSLTKLGTNKLTLTGSNTFTGNIYIKEGTLANLLNVRGINGNGNWGPATSTIYLGDATVGANATLQDNGDGNGLSDSSHPINVVSGGGTRTISYGGSGAGLVNGPITLNNNLTVGNNGIKQFILGSSVTGTGNLTIVSTIANATWPFQLTGAINPVGAITNITTSICPCTISGVIGSNVTAVVQNSTTSKLVLSGTNNLYAGTTTVLLGTLETQKTNSLGVASSLVIATDNGTAKMYLNFTGTNTITSLKLGNVTMPKGVYGTNAPIGNLIFSGLGALKVTTGPNGTLVRFY